MSGGFFINKFGRKGTMMYNSVFFALSYLCLAAAQNVWMLFVGRFLSGMASGKDLFRNGQSTPPISFYEITTQGPDLGRIPGPFCGFFGP